MVFLDSLYSPPHPHHFQLLSAEKYVSLVCVFFINRAKERQFLWYCRRSPRWHLQFSQRFTLCITIHTPIHSNSQIYIIFHIKLFFHFTYTYIYIFFVLCITIHTPPSKFTKKYIIFNLNLSIHFSYACIYMFFVLYITIQTSPSQFSHLQNWSHRERKMLDVYGIKKFSYFLWLFFGKLVAGVMLTKWLCLISSSPPPWHYKDR